MILITGGSGQLGGDLIRIIENADAPSHKRLDIKDFSAVSEYIAAMKPSAVIHCAAYNNVDNAEYEEDECMRVNAEGTSNIARSCAKNGIYMIYISSDYVFDGEKHGLYETYDLAKPLSVYGKSKLAGEIATLEFPQSLIIRTSWLFSKTERNFVGSILKAAGNKRVIDVVSDQIGSPTYSEDLAAAIADLLKTRPSGIIHMTNEGICSRTDFAGYIVSLAQLDCKIHDIESDMYPALARRPKNSSLSKKSLDHIGISRLPHWRDALERRMKTEKGL